MICDIEKNNNKRGNQSCKTNQTKQNKNKKKKIADLLWHIGEKIFFLLKELELSAAKNADMFCFENGVLIPPVPLLFDGVPYITSLMAYPT